MSSRTSTASGAPGAPGAQAKPSRWSTPRERRLLRFIERAVGQRLEARRVPTASDVAQRQRERLAATLQEIIESEELESPMALVDELAAYYDPSLIAAAALSLLLDAAPAEEPQVDLPVSSEGAERGMTRLFMNIGAKDGLRPSDVVGAIANEAKIPGKAIGVIEIKDTYAFAEIPADLAQRVLDALRDKTIRNRPVRLELAQPQQHAPVPDGRRDGRHANDGRDRHDRARPRG